MRILFLLLVTFFTVPMLPSHVSADELFERTLTFEREQPGGLPAGWGGGPAETLSIDGEVVHSGRWAARIDRDADSPRNFSSLTKSLPVDFSGGALLLTGWIRTEDVEGGAALWLRQDAGGESVAFRNTQRNPVSGTSDWQRVVVRLPLEESADTVVFGGLLSGTGTAWFDDFTLTIDGRFLDEAPPRAVTVLHTDTEFTLGSGVETTELTQRQIDHLVLLGEIWGFLKYHHPAVTSGQWHWDFELFRVLPEVLTATDDRAFRDTVLAWLDRLGRVDPCDPCPELATNDLHLEPPLAWIRDSERLGARLSERLVEIHARRSVDPAPFYVRLSPNVGNPDFRNELAYGDVPLPDPGFQLLALFRAWNVARWWFPYRDLIDEDWRAVLAEFVPRIMGAGDPDAYALELMAFIARFDDGHAGLWSATDLRPPRGRCRLPVAVEFVEDRPVVSDLLDPESTDLIVGDVFVAFDGERVDDLLAEWAPYHSGSNETARRKSLAFSMTRGHCGPCELTIEREGRIEEIDALRVPVADLDTAPARSNTRPGPGFQRLSDEIAYLRIDGVSLDAVDSYVDGLAGTKGLVIDLRGYPSSFVVFAFGQHLVAEPTPFVRFTRGDLTNPGAFHWSEPLSLAAADAPYDGRVVVLVDHHAHSSSEYHAMAFRAAPGAVVVGSTTAGADGNISPFVLPGGHRSMVSGIGIFYPDRRPTQRIGILPDVEVRPTIEGIRAGRDEVLEEGIRQILGPGADEDAVPALARRE